MAFTQITPNEDQLKALDQLMAFIFSDQQCFVLKGKAGTGKTTVIGLLEEALEKQAALKRKLGIQVSNQLEIKYAATTNKAAEALRIATNKDASTVHSMFGIKLFTDFESSHRKRLALYLSLVHH